MKKNNLGDTGIEVSQMCLGTLTMGPLQKNLPVKKGAELIIEAYKNGVNFLDTAELYNNYEYIKYAIKKIGEKPIIATKSYAYDSETAKFSIEKARKEMDIDYIDIFLLHEQESEHTLKGHWEAVEYFLAEKAKGKIGAFGISTHRIAGVRAANNLKEIEIIHPIINYKGIGICDGNIKDMLTAVEEAYLLGKGIYAMKIFAGGNLIKNYKKSLEFVLSKNFIDSIAIGVQSVEELNKNIESINNFAKGIDIVEINKIIDKKIIIEYWCTACGKCVIKCHQNALSLENDQIIVDHAKCLLCGYCSQACEDFAIKVY